MAVVLPDDLSRLKFPQPGIVVAADCDKVGRVGGEGAVPDPALMIFQDNIRRQRSFLRDHINIRSSERVGAVRESVTSSQATIQNP